MILLLWLWSCVADPTPPPSGAEAVPVRVHEVERATFADAFTLSATLEAAQVAMLFPGAPGRVRSVSVRIGDEVAEGTVLMRVDASAFAAGVDQARAAVTMAEAQAEQARTAQRRYEALKARDAVTDAEFEGIGRQLELAEAQVTQARAALVVAQQRLRDTTVRAPFDGVIIHRSVDPGDVVGGATPRPPLGIADLSSFRVKTAVSELVASQITAGTELTVRVDALPGEGFTAVVERVNAAVDPVARTVAVEARLEADPRLRHGMAAEVALEGVGRSHPAVPRTALLDRDDGQARVMVLDGETARAVVVHYGRSQSEVVPVLEGLEPGDAVLVAGHTRLRDGDAVRVVGVVTGEPAP